MRQPPPNSVASGRHDRFANALAEGASVDGVAEDLPAVGQEANRPSKASSRFEARFIGSIHEGQYGGSAIPTDQREELRYPIIEKRFNKVAPALLGEGRLTHRQPQPAAILGMKRKDFVVRHGIMLPWVPCSRKLR
jgi:hypothetical protein